MPHFRTRVLRAIGGWDAWNVTEDADLGLRLARTGHAVGCFNSTTHEEAPISLTAWLGQRRRWQKGWLQTIATHLSDPARFVRELGLFRALLSAGLVGSMALGTLVGPLFALAVWRSVQDGNLLQPQSLGEIIVSTCACVLFLAGGTSMLGSLCIGMSRRGLWRLAPWLLLLPVYQLISMIAAWQGLLELCRRPFHWQKTAHGVSRMRKRNN